jgi:hypothetical protein
MDALFGALMGMQTLIALKLFVFLLAVSVVAGCAKEEPPLASHHGSATAATPTDNAIPSPAGRVLATTVDVSVRAHDVATASANAREKTRALGGYVSNASTSGEGEDLTALADLRVPADKLDELRRTLASLGDIASESEKVDDVTLQHADLDARLKNARTEEARLLDLMSSRTGSVADLLATERELARVQETIERLAAEKRAMNDSVDFATVHLVVSAPNTPVTKTPGRSIAHAWSLGVSAAHAIAVFVLMAVATLSPTIVPLFAFVALLVFLVRRLRRPVA